MKIWKRVSLRCLVLISSRAMDWYEQKSAATCSISSLARPSNCGGVGRTGLRDPPRLGPEPPGSVTVGSSPPPLEDASPSTLGDKKMPLGSPYPRQHEIPNFFDDWSFFPELLHGFGERICTRM